MPELLARLLLGGALIFTAGAKLSDRRASVAAMATFGFATPPARALAWSFAVVAELGLGVAVIAGSATASLLAAGLMLMFAATLGSALIAGKAGAPCGCLGPRSEVGPGALLGNLALAAGFAALAL